MESSQLNLFEISVLYSTEQIFYIEQLIGCALPIERPPASQTQFSYCLITEVWLTILLRNKSLGMGLRIAARVRSVLQARRLTKGAAC